MAMTGGMNLSSIPCSASVCAHSDGLSTLSRNHPDSEKLRFVGDKTPATNRIRSGPSSPDVRPLQTETT